MSFCIWFIAACLFTVYCLGIKEPFCSGNKFQIIVCVLLYHERHKSWCQDDWIPFFCPNSWSSGDSRAIVSDLDGLIGLLLFNHQYFIFQSPKPKLNKFAQHSSADKSQVRPECSEIPQQMTPHNGCGVKVPQTNSNETPKQSHAPPLH